MDDREETESHVDLSEKSWNRVINAAAKAGYREGVEEGKQSVFQEGFDIGYEDGFKTAFVLGKYKGLAMSLANEQHSASLVDDILDKTRRGACCICAKNPNASKNLPDDFTEPPFQDVRNEQRIHSEKAIETLRKHFDKTFKDRGMPVDNFSF